MTRTLAKKIESMCTSKGYFPTKERAVKAARRFHLHTYKCDYCDGFHLTKIPKQRFKKIVNHNRAAALNQQDSNKEKHV